VQELNAYLAAGGDFAVLLFRSGYHGWYPSPLKPGALVRYDCDNRPFTLWVFMEPQDSWQDLLALLGPNLQPEFTFRLGANDLKPTLATHSLPSAQFKGGQRIFHSVVTNYPPEMQPLVEATVDSRAVDAAHFVPFQFDLELDPAFLASLNRSGESLGTWLQANLEPDLQCWELKRVRGAIQIVGLKLVVGKHSVLDWPPTAKPVGASKRVRLVLPVKSPATSGYMCAWVLTLRLAPQSQSQVLPEGYSTLDDTTPIQASRILNLGPMLTAIKNGSYIPGRLMFFTKWY
jgi:hypothetical protein